MKHEILLILMAIVASFLFINCSGKENVAGPALSGPVISVDSVEVIEGDTALFAISLFQGGGDTISFLYRTVNGSAISGTDYVAIVATAGSIAPGDTTLNVKVATINNNIPDSARAFSLVISNVVGAEVSNSIGVASIIDDEAGVLSYSLNVKPILISRCAVTGCHGGGSNSGGFSMGTGAPYNIVRTAAGNHGPIISAGNATASNLYLKTTSFAPFLGRMPLGGQPLTIGEQNLIRDWINGGALDN